MHERAFIALGSNAGDRHAFLAGARSALSLLPATSLLAATAVSETAPFGPVAQGPYLNQMVAVSTGLAPSILLGALHHIERKLGRTRHRRWGARTIDLDLLRHGANVLRSAELTLPHPGLVDRRFWQEQVRELETLLCRVA